MTTDGSSLSLVEGHEVNNCSIRGWLASVACQPRTVLGHTSYEATKERVRIKVQIAAFQRLNLLCVRRPNSDRLHSLFLPRTISSFSRMRKTRTDRGCSMRGFLSPRRTLNLGRE